MSAHRDLATNRPVVVDLFCGCGGLSLGARQAGFHSAVAIDHDETLTYSFTRNFPGASLRLADIGALSSRAVTKVSGPKVDGVIGGPPCQGFSSIGRRDRNDPRRNLLIDFFRLIAGIKPKFFLMENVRGLEYAKNREVLDRGLELLPKRYKIVGPLRLDSANFGAATSRPRIFVIGFDRDEMLPLDASMFDGSKKPTTVQEAIADLQDIKAHGYDKDGYDLWSLNHSADLSQYSRSLRARTKIVTGHRKTFHKSEIVERFSAIEQGEKDTVGKHVRLSWNGQCPTLRAGTGAELGSYQSVRPIHPSTPRVITVREAARLQGFPDGFRFHPTTWHSFRMIGNSVSPIIARALLSVIATRLREAPLQQAAE